MSLISTLTRRLHSAEGRIVTGAGMFAALVNGLLPEAGRPFDPGKAATVLVAAIVWLYSEIGGSSSPSKVDIALYHRIKDVMNNDALSFLKTHDFGGSIHDSETKAVGIICSWHGADAEFRDPKIQRSWEICRGNFEALDRLYAEHLGPAAHSSRLSVIPPGTNEWAMPKHLLEAVDRLNVTSTRAYDAFNEFDRLARNRLEL